MTDYILILIICIQFICLYAIGDYTKGITWRTLEGIGEITQSQKIQFIPNELSNHFDQHLSVLVTSHSL